MGRECWVMPDGASSPVRAPFFKKKNRENVGKGATRRAQGSQSAYFLANIWTLGRKSRTLHVSGSKEGMGSSHASSSTFMPTVGSSQGTV